MAMMPVHHMVEAMLMTERSIAAHGWGIPGSMIVFREGKDQIRIQSLPIELPTGQSVYEAGQSAAARPDQARAVIGKHPNIIALAFVSEAWSVLGPHIDVNEDTVSSHPEAHTCRELTAVDIWGRGYTASRIKGTQPEAQQADFAGGRIPYGLVLIMRTLAQFLPRADLPALDQLYDSMDPSIDADGAFHTEVDAS